MMITLIREHMTHVGIRFIKLAEEHDMQANVVFEDAASGKSFEHDLVRVMFKLRTIESKQRQFIMQVPYELRDFKDEQVVAQDVFQGLYHNDIYNKGANGTVSLFVNYMEAMKIAEAFKTTDTNHSDI